MFQELALGEVIGNPVKSQCPKVIQHLWARCRIRVHTGKTQVWNREEGVRPTACDVLERIAVAADPAARVWRGSGDTDLPEAQTGDESLGHSVGTSIFRRGPFAEVARAADVSGADS